MPTVSTPEVLVPDNPPTVPSVSVMKPVNSAATLALGATSGAKVDTSDDGEENWLRNAAGQ